MIDIRSIRSCVGIFGVLLGMAGLMVSGAQGATPSHEKKMYECRPITAENRVQQPPPAVGAAGIPVSPTSLVPAGGLATELCPVGEIAYPTQFYAPHRNVGKSLLQAHVSGDDQPAAGEGGVSHPSNEPEFGGYRYAETFWLLESEGGGVGMQIAQPQVDNEEGTHSLAEMSFADETSEKTVELGWTVDPGQFGDRRPHLFTYVNKDFYATNGEPGGDCYNCEFVPVEGSHFVPGQALEPTDAPVPFAVEFTQGNWWVSVDGEWIGFLKESFYNGEYTSSEVHSFYGEVFDRNPTFPSAMGNGLFASSVGSAEMSDPFHFTSDDVEEPESLATGFRSESDPHLYTLGRIAADKRSWHFGGPGGASVRLVNVERPECLAVGGASAEPGAQMTLEPCAAEQPSQEFAQALFPDESFQLIARGSELCVAKQPSAGLAPIQAECDTPSTTAGQRYKFVPQPTAGAEVKVVNQESGECLAQVAGAVTEASCSAAPGAAGQQGWEVLH